MHPKDIRIEDYTYLLPDERIAKYPMVRRDASKLLVYDKGAITEDTYAGIAGHIPAGALMVFNQTKVVHARLLFKKPTGGAIEVFCLAPADNMDIQTAMLQKGKAKWECLVGGASKWKDGMTIALEHAEPKFTLSARIVDKNASAYVLELEWDNEGLTFSEVLHYAGKVPLPPYLNRDAAAIDDTRYQTVFAKEDGSVAAPTAGLHFTDEVMRSLAAKGIDKAFVTLHVGAGTFRPVKSATMAEHDMHAEWIDVSRSFVHRLMESGGGKVVAVGTTSLRTLESLYWIGNQLANGETPDFAGIAVSQWEPYGDKPACTKQEAFAAIANYMTAHELTKLVTRTQILIAPGYTFKVVNGLVTNFHQPQSTLLLLVSAFIGDEWRKVYDYAMAHEYRFLSYGDGSLLWRTQR